jgi:hypothetical protein
MPRKAGSTQRKINYKLQVRNILENKYEDAGEFSTHEDIAKYLKTKDIEYTAMALQKIFQNDTNAFLKITHI